MKSDIDVYSKQIWNDTQAYFKETLSPYASIVCTFLEGVGFPIFKWHMTGKIGAMMLTAPFCPELCGSLWECPPLGLLPQRAEKWKFREMRFVYVCGQKRMVCASTKYDIIHVFLLNNKMNKNFDCSIELHCQAGDLGAAPTDLLSWQNDSQQVSCSWLGPACQRQEEEEVGRK